MSAATAVPLVALLTMDLAVPPVKVASNANPPVVPILLVTVPIAFVPVGNGVEIVTAPVLTAVTFVFREANVVSVDAPVGSGNAVAEIGIADWSDAITTGSLFADVACPFGFWGLYAINFPTL